MEVFYGETVWRQYLRLWDVVFEKEGPDWYLRVLIDKADGSTMDTDTCADVSHALDPILDEADPIEQSYYLEVGSPGLGRKLTRPEHYTAVQGQKISVKLYKGKFNVALIQDVVADEDWYDEHSEIGITEAQNIRKDYKVGDRVVTPLKTKDFGRIAAQTAKHVIRQGIREAERSQQLSEIQSRAHDIVQATVTRVDPEKGIVAVDLGKGGEAILPRNEQVPGETYTEGQVLQVYVVDVVGDRVAAVVEKLGGEKIDIVKWSEDVSEFISAALSPAKVLKVELLPGETRSCRVTVPDQQLSLAIGNKGQNARLCARLTGYNIDIRPESGYYGEDEEPKAEQPKTEETAE